MFGWFVLLMASVILVEEVNPTVGAAVACLTLVAAGMSFAGTPATRTAHCAGSSIDRQPPPPQPEVHSQPGIYPGGYGVTTA